MKKTKFLTALLIGTSLTTNAMASVASGTCGENCSWTIDDDYNLSIEGTGPMDNFMSGGESPWGNYMDRIGTVTVGEGITSIGDSAFDWSASHISQISLPSTLESIGAYAFSFVDVNTLIIPDTVTSIGEHAFSASYITNLVIPDSVTEIGRGAFDHINVQNLYCEEGIEDLCQDALADSCNGYWLWSASKLSCQGQTMDSFIELKLYTKTDNGRYVSNGKDYDSFEDLKNGHEHDHSIAENPIFATTNGMHPYAVRSKSLPNMAAD